MGIILIRAFIIYLFIIIALRIMGKRQLGELSTHEFVITILISATATVPLEDSAIPLTNSLLPILLLISLEIIESALSMKVPKLSTLLEGRPIYIIRNGVLRQESMRRMRLTLRDLTDALRREKVFDISTVENAIAETNGTLSVQLKSEAAPPSAEDLKTKVKRSDIPAVLVADGKPVTEYFDGELHSLNEIDQAVKATGARIEDIMLLTCDRNGKIYCIKKESEEK